jgi:CHAT domain-containing protein
VTGTTETGEAGGADAAALGETASQLFSTYQARGDPGALEAAIAAWHEALALTLPYSPDRASRLNNLGVGLLTRYEHAGNLADLDAAIEHAREALALTPPNNPARSARLNSLGKGLLTRFGRLGDAADLDAAIEFAREVVALTPPSNPDGAAGLNNLGIALLTRFERLGNQADLDTAIQLELEAVSLTPPDSLDRAARLNNLGIALLTRFERFGNPADLDAAIEFAREAVALTPSDSPDRAARLDNLGNTLRVRFERFGNPADLDAAIEFAREAVALTPSDSPDRAARLDNLGNTLRVRFERFGNPADLDAAIEFAREAVALAPPDSPDRAGRLSNLGNTLRVRFERFGNPADLDAAIEFAREAVALAPPDSPDRAAWLDNLGIGLLTRFRRLGNQADLDAGIGHTLEALALTPPDSPTRATWLNNLSMGLLTRFERLGNQADLDAAIEHAREALTQTPPNNPYRAGMFNNLGVALLTRFERLDNSADLDAAIGCYALALQLLSEEDPRRHGISNNHRLALQRRAALGGFTIGAIAPGVRIATEQAPDRVARASVGVSLVYAATTFHQRNWSEAAGLYLAAFSKREIALAQAAPDNAPPAETADAVALPEAALFSDRLEFLRSFANAGANAALALLRTGGEGAADQAVLAMEQGLQQGLQESFDLIEIDLERHRATGRLGADRFRNARAKLAELTKRAALGGAAVPSSQALDTARQEFEHAIAGMQATPGFERFLQPVDLASIWRAAAAAPLVYLGATEHGGLALVVPDDTAPVIPLELPDLTTRLVQTIAEPYEKARSAISDQRPIRPWLDTLDATLRALWLPAMGPLCAELERLGLTRAVLIPYGGILASLPWHAAWTVGAGRQDERRYACDGIAWRYAPNATLLGSSRRWPPRRGQAEEVVVVYHADSPGDPEREAEAIRAAMGKVTLLTGRKATPENVRRAWRAARYAHLDTHAEANPDEPLKSCLLLAGNRELSVGDLLREPQPLEARLVVLASCGSAVTSGRQGVDEIVSFPAALLRAGAAQVLASSWPVWNDATVPLMAGFYAGLGQDESADLAETLLASARAVRSRGSVPLSVERAADRQTGGSFWRRLMGRPGGLPVAATALRQRVGYRMKLAPQDDAVRGAATPDPDTEPTNWNHPYFWAGFAVHGTTDRVGTQDTAV